MKRFICFAAVFAATAVGAQTFDIAGYCSEMASRQSLGSEWREQCVSTLEVQQKYLDKYQREVQRRSQTERFIAKGEWMTELMKLRRQEKEAKPQDTALAAARVDQHMTQCELVWAVHAECDEFRKEFEASRAR